MNPPHQPSSVKIRDKLPTKHRQEIRKNGDKAACMNQRQKWTENHNKPRLWKKEFHLTSPTIASTAGTKHVTTFQESNAEKNVPNTRYLQPGTRTLHTPTT
ncbi:hypothetical protein J1614_003494 [Plenodomus biglobosus]|nr:hypothetical protein J1614_003494 [Plenodomus biglobosus]